ncbi:tyrosine-protein kinase-like protein 4 [Sarcoptes scabiei]|uniref:Tyrosine-protein kinase-like protein 4 n=1 Tax=Sarcoptes scabiei TaxID=52283 RepID=A0A132AJT5_SARSC|nr:tyrosine-protein kinase-like protein 4 [Sarcoptes scabiei]
MRFNTNGYGQHQTPMPSSSSVEVNKNSQPSNHNYNSVGGNNAFTSTNNNGQPSSVSISNEFGDDMKCIPEISQKDIEILHRQFGCSQYGDLMLAQLSSATTTTKASGVFGAAPKNAINTNNNSNNNSNTTISNTVNDFGTETDTKNRSETFETNDSDKILVVLKTLQNEKLKSEFLHEMKSKWFISAKSERVGKLIGFLSSFSSSSSSSSSTLSSPISSVHHTAMVVECGDCDLAHFLRNCDKKSIGLQSLLFIGSEVAAGMKYLESLGYVHRDLSARNCLIYTGGKTLRVKITDFAAFLSTNSAEYCNGIALRWIAPEALINGAYTTKSDVFSYGVTLWEILTYALDCSSNSVYYQPTYATGNYSLNGCNQSNALCNDNSNSNGNENETSKRQGTTRISYRMALPKPTTCPSEIYDLMLECWQLNEQIRPSFKDITQFLSVRNSFSTANLNNCSNTNNTVNTELQNISSC